MTLPPIHLYPNERWDIPPDIAVAQKNLVLCMQTHRYEQAATWAQVLYRYFLQCKIQAREFEKRWNQDAYSYPETAFADTWSASGDGDVEYFCPRHKYGGGWPCPTCEAEARTIVQEGIKRSGST